MGTPNPYQQAYQTNQVTTAAPGELTLMLYNGAVRFLKQANQAIAAQDWVVANQRLQQVQSICYELMATLDMGYEISKQLMALYEFMVRHLVEANVEKDSHKVDEVLALTEELRDAWREAVKQSGAGQLTAFTRK